MKNRIILSLVAILMLFGYADNLQAALPASTRKLARELAKMSGGSAGQVRARSITRSERISQNVESQQDWLAESLALKELGLPDVGRLTDADINGAVKKYKSYNHPDRFMHHEDKQNATKRWNNLENLIEAARIVQLKKQYGVYVPDYKQHLITHRTVADALMMPAMTTRIAILNSKIDHAVAKGMTAKEIAEEFPELIKYLDKFKFIGHATYTLPLFAYGVTYKKSSPTEDDLYNSHMETIALDNDQLPANKSENQETTEKIQEFNQILHGIVDKTLTETPYADSVDTNFINTTELSANSPDSVNSPDNEIAPTLPTKLPAQPTTWWDSITSGGKYLVDSANNALELATANPVTTGVIAGGVVGATSWYLYKKYYKPFQPAEPIFIEEQETVSE